MVDRVPSGPAGTGPDDPLADALRVLGRTMLIDPPADDVPAAILSRLASEPVPGRRPGWQSAVADLGTELRRRRRAATAVAVAVLLLLLAVTPAGAKIVEWLGLGGVVIVQDSGAAASSDPSTVGDPAATAGLRDVPLDEARSAVAFPLVVPLDLGPPERVLVGSDGRVVSMLWATDRDPIRLDQFAGQPDWMVVKKYADDVLYAAVDGRDAIWLRRPHPLVYVDPQGVERSETARTAGPTLIWQRGQVTLRLEGVRDLSTATQIAESAA